MARRGTTLVLVAMLSGVGCGAEVGSTGSTSSLPPTSSHGAPTTTTVASPTTLAAPPSTIATVTTATTTAPATATAAVALVPAVLIERPCDVSVAGATVRCSFLEVPERRDVAGARTIRLWVAVVTPAGADPALPPFVDVSGGPGDAASADWVHGSASLDMAAAPRTVVIMDQRGTGRSEPRLDCAGLTQADDVTASWADRVANHRAIAAECHESLVEAGVDLEGYDTIESAADFVDLRRALGAEQFVLRGTSYGARVAREVYRQDPAGVAALVLDSPLTSAPQGAVSLVARAADVVDRVAAACNAQPECAAGGDFAENLARAAARLEVAPFAVPGSDIVVDSGTLHAGAFQLAYDSDLLPLLPGAATALAAGDDSLLPALADEAVAEYDDPRDAPAQALFEVISCADDSAALNEADQAIYADPGVWEELVLSWWLDCEIWAVTQIPAGVLESVSGDVPVLELSGSLDPITPPSFAEEVQAQFPDATFVLVPGGGHGDSEFDDCTHSIVARFIDAPTTPVDTSCVGAIPAPYSTD